MNTASILESKGKGVVTTTAEKSLLHIAKLLARHCIGCIVIVEDEKVCGIMSEDDLIRVVGQDGPKALSRPVSDFMTTPVFTAGTTDTYEWLMSEMTKRQSRHIPVLESGRLIGIVSLGDLVKLNVASAESESASMQKYIRST
jgi:CBS domain-containing protein